MVIKKSTSTIHTTAKLNRSIKYIVIHYTAGVTSKQGSALNTANYFKTTSVDVSADFIVDDTDIVMYNGNIRNRYTWHCGGSRYATKGGRLYGKCTNANSIGIEICSTNTAGRMQDANSTTYSFTEEAVNNAKELVLYLMKLYNIPEENVIRHYDVTGKPCPGIIGWNTESGSNDKWKSFVDSISTSTGTEVKGSKLYYVQVGAFSNKSNAEAYLKAAQKKYPNAFIKTSGLYYVQVGAFSSVQNAETYLSEVRKTYPNAFIKEST